jgi:hypothetical protein
MMSSGTFYNDKMMHCMAFNIQMKIICIHSYVNMSMYVQTYKRDGKRI